MVLEKLKDLRKLELHINVSNNGSTRFFYPTLTDISEKVGKFIKFIEFVRKEKGYCTELYLNDLHEVWELSEMIRAVSENYKILLKREIHCEIVENLFDLLRMKLPEQYVTLGETCPSIFSYHEVYSTEIAKYVEIGKHLSENEQIKSIKADIEALGHHSHFPSYYATIIGPSLMGKTQPVFTLSHLMDVFYINLGQSEFNAISKIFIDALSEDREEQKSIHPYAQDDQKYRLHGLIATLARWKKFLDLKDPTQWFHKYKQIDRIVIPKLSVNDFCYYCRGKFINGIWVLIMFRL